MKSIQVIKSLNRGGAEALLYSYFKYFGGKDHMLCVLSGNRLEMLDAFDQLGIKPVVFNLFDNGFSFPEYLRFLKFVAEHRTGYVFHSHLPLAGVVLRSAKLFFSFKSVYTEHNVIRMYHPVTSFLNSATYFLENQIIACSSLVGESIPRLFASRVFTVQNGVDTNRFSFVNSLDKWSLLASKGEIRMICIAGFREEKNHLLLLNVIRILVLKDFNVQLKLIGDGLRRPDLESYVVANNLQEFVFFEGFQSDVYPYLVWANFFCLTSNYEGLPVSLLEAMSAGCIPVCSNVGGISEVYKSDFFPLINLTNNFDSDADLFVASMLDILTLSCDDLFAKSKYASYIIHEFFNIEIMMTKLVGVYKKV